MDLLLSPPNSDVARPPAAVVPVGPGYASSPEGRLLHIYRAIAEAHLDEALTQAERLAHDQPNFRLAQLVYGDLLMVRRGELSAFGEVLRTAHVNARSEVDQLRDEAGQRIAALRQRPPAASVPSQFVLLPKSVRHAIAVDASRSRLYLFENQPDGIRLLADYYVSVGKQGIDKLVEGDQKTPLGVYHIASSFDQSNQNNLDDRFGVGVLPLNYPNAYDRAAGRTGSGILLHGVPASTYSRVPKSTDGCIVLANDDLERLARTISPRDTPVVITNQLEWVAPTQARREADDFLNVLAQWQRARVDSDRSALGAFYIDVEMATVSEAVAMRKAEKTSKRKRRSAKPIAVAGFDDVAVLSWNDKHRVMVVSFRELGAHGERAPRMTRQYWARDGDAWKIFAQS